ncbi:MAG: 3-dehydroquinate synthase [Chloroflexota bacterium]
MNKMNWETLPVQHPNGRYDVIVGQNLLPSLRDLANIKGRVAIITDTNVGPHHAAKCGKVDCLITVPAGEMHKNLDTVRTIYDQLFAAGLDRKSTLVALGGGVVGDMTGFVAATFLRGVDFVQCPTTLLSMVDASVGGKTGVDMPQGKNLVGAFKQPTAVLADITTFDTLPAVEYACGMAEVIKHGLLNDPDILRQVEAGEWARDSSDGRLQARVAQAIQVKRDVVEEDPYEHGRRAYLNLGHTFGHAIEKVSQFRVPHGEGVAMGLVAAMRLGGMLEYCDPKLQQQVEGWLTAVNLPTRIPADLDPEAIFDAMVTDKKQVDKKRRFILLREIGAPFITEAGEVEKTAVVAVLKALRAV